MKYGSRKQKKRKAGKVMRTVLLCLAAFLAGSALLNGICCAVEKDSIRYGQKIKTDGGTMCVETYGSGKNVVVVLPGSGNCSPVLDFRYLADLLSEECTVVVPEPFGYGLSDITDKERTFENIAQEIHQCMSELGYRSYTLMGHSISGITMLEYANRYPDEVNAVIALDTSVPKQIREYTETMKFLSVFTDRVFRVLRGTGIVRLYFEAGGTYGISQGSMTDEEFDTYKRIAYARLCNRNIIEELECFLNTDALRMFDMTYPDSVPVLTFLAEDSTAQIPVWEQLHRELTSNENSATEILTGGHYVYQFHPEEIAEKTLGFINSGSLWR